MKRNFLNYSLMAAVVCGLSLGFTSCKDDEDNNEASEVMNAEQTDEAVKAWSWVSVLTDETDQAADWQSKTYTVTIGEASSNKPTSRIVFVKDLEEARNHFAALAGCDPKELNSTKTVQAGELGKMEWAPSAENAPNVAVVKVESKLFKQFDQLTYCRPDQAEDNAGDINGNCYYRLGDVVEDANGYYWVCVRPSFFLNKAKDSYWVNIFNDNPETGRGKESNAHPGMPANNIYSKYNTKYNNNTILLPTCLKMDRMQNYNLANLIWAMIDPDFYGDAHYDLAGFNYTYHGKKFIRRVIKQWQEGKIYEKLFNRSYAQMKAMKHVNFFYYGYHWKIGSTAGVWIYKTDGYQKTYQGRLDDDDTLFEMKKAGYGFDITRYTSKPQATKGSDTSGNDKLMAPAVQFDEKTGTGYWVVRVSTGKQLFKNYDPYKKMESLYDTYRYNDAYELEVGQGTDVPSDLEIDDDVVLEGEEK